MKTIEKITELRSVLKAEREKGKSIGFIPTMGYLHVGHAALIDEARKMNEIVVLSIFVNPTQFGPNEDYDAYPRDFTSDVNLAKEHGVDYIFYPSVEEMYGIITDPTVVVQVKNRADVLCGKSRSGHFDGVATIVTKLFHIVQPDRAYFGKKDAQQFAVINGLVNDLNFDIDIIGIETVREADGLACSSRNVRLSKAERAEAPAIYQSLLKVTQLIQEGKSVEAAVREGKNYLYDHCQGVIDYYESYSFPRLDAVEDHTPRIIIAVAVKFAKVRLIDNVILVRE